MRKLIGKRIVMGNSIINILQWNIHYAAGYKYDENNLRIATKIVCDELCEQWIRLKVLKQLY